MQAKLHKFLAEIEGWIIIGGFGIAAFVGVVFGAGVFQRISVVIGCPATHPKGPVALSEVASWAASSRRNCVFVQFEVAIAAQS
jgi:hypothetical protein